MIATIEMQADSYVGVMGRADSDEHYVLDLCDEVLGERSSRQHLFDWLVGDPSPETGKARRLPVDAYWERFKLVVEFREHQHYEAVAHFDKPDRVTVSGVHRGEQRRIYDQRREELVPAHGLRLIIIKSSDFELRGKNLRRSPDSDREVVRRNLDADIEPTTASLDTVEWADAPASQERNPTSGGEPTYRRKMTEPTTPIQLSGELGVSDRAIRQWLRDQGWQSVPYARWELTPDQAKQVREHFRG